MVMVDLHIQHKSITTPCDYTAMEKKSKRKGVNDVTFTFPWHFMLTLSQSALAMCANQVATESSRKKQQQFGIDFSTLNFEYKNKCYQALRSWCQNNSFRIHTPLEMTLLIGILLEKKLAHEFNVRESFSYHSLFLLLLKCKRTSGIQHCIQMEKYISINFQLNYLFSRYANIVDEFLR